MSSSSFLTLVVGVLRCFRTVPLLVPVLPSVLTALASVLLRAVEDERSRGTLSIAVELSMWD